MKMKEKEEKKTKIEKQGRARGGWTGHFINPFTAENANWHL